MRPYRIDRRLLLVLVYLAGCFAVGAPDAGAQDAPRPHVIHIVSDDQGWRDVGFHGSPDIRTPNLDRLPPTRGRPQEVFVPPLCPPTRAALLTGRHPFRYGLQSFVIPASGTYGLPTDERLLPQALKE